MADKWFEGAEIKGWPVSKEFLEKAFELVMNEQKKPPEKLVSPFEFELEKARAEENKRFAKMSGGSG